MDKVDKYKIKDINELMDFYKTYRNTSNYKFRGQSNYSWDLIPKAGRETYEQRNDKELFRQWKRRAKNYLDKENYNDLELLTIAQHHGLPTRLLDWSYNPLIATFFACIDNPKIDGIIYACNPERLSIPENLSDPFNTQEESIIFIQPEGSSNRIMSQFGYFSLHNPPKLPIKDSSSAIRQLDKIIIPAELKKDIIFMLHQFGISNLTIYPDLEGLTKHLCWFYENYEYWQNKT